jgi:hypothetical protein
MTERDITRLLAQRHHEDVFVPGCKNGESYAKGLMIMDAWAMRKSWAHPCVYGYEIKVSRSDFMRDEKWLGYLLYCNAFSFVCPSGLIQVEELPRDVGLLWVSTTGRSLVTKRRAAHRRVDIPEDVFRYILMCRARILAPNEISRDTCEDNLNYWREWLAKDREKQEIGYMVSRRLQEIVRERIEVAEKENARLRDGLESLQWVREVCEEFRIDAYNFWHQKENIQRIAREKLNEAACAIPDDLVKNLELAIHSLRSLERLNTPPSAIDETRHAMR